MMAWTQGEGCSLGQWRVEPCVVIGLLFCVLAVASCAPDDGGELLEDGAGDAQLESELSYALTWVWGDASPLEGGGWEVHNDLGYRVRVSRGYVVSYSEQLVECPSMDEGDASGATGWLNKLFGIRVAHAGHSSDALNPAAITTSYVESLTTPTNLDVGVVVVPAQRYCEHHYLVARGDSDTDGLPDDVSMQGKSLYVEGSYQGPGDAETTSFVVSTELAWGALSQLWGEPADADFDEPSEIDTGAGNLRIVVARDVSQLFAGIDFEAMTEVEIERRLLASLVGSATVTFQYR